MDLEIKKDLTSNWFKMLQESICHNINDLEKNQIKFESTTWKRNLEKDEGGGEFKILKNGKIFDKVGVNFSKVYGKFPKQFQKNIPGAKKNPKFWASGISVVMHMKNPLIPAMHFNTRYICTTHDWFGGGMDVTPSKKDMSEKKDFHKILKNMCDRHNKKYYSRYKKWCDKYFYLTHKKETRGIGGIFFDYLYKDWDQNFKFVREVGICFAHISKEIIEEKLFSKWSLKQKKINCLKEVNMLNSIYCMIEERNLVLIRVEI